MNEFKENYKVNYRVGLYSYGKEYEGGVGMNVIFCGVVIFCWVFYLWFVIIVI